MSKRTYPNQAYLNFKGILATVFFLCICIMLAACQKQVVPLKVGSNLWPGYEPLYLARSLGFYNNSAVHLVEFPSTSTVIRHLNSGTIDAACVTLDEALTIRANGLDIVVIAIMDFSNGADVLLGQADITSLEALKGKMIGVEQNAVGAVLLDGALRAARLEIQDVELKYLTPDQHEQAWKKRQVDAIVTYEPYRTRLLSAGANQIFDSSHIPERITDVLIVKRSALKQHDKNIRHLLRGYFLALDYLENKPRDAAIRMSDRQGVAPAEVPELFNGLTIPDLNENKNLLSGKTPKFSKNVFLLKKIMLENKLLLIDPDTENLLSDEYIPESIP